MTNKEKKQAQVAANCIRKAAIIISNIGMDNKISLSKLSDIVEILEEV